MRKQLIEAICLIKVNVEKIVRNLVYYQPVSFPLNDEIQFLIQNCISDNPKKGPSFYSFSLLNYTGFAMFFEHLQESYILVIVTSHLFPSLYFEFLHEAIKYIIEKDMSLESCVDKFWELLSSWRLTGEEKSQLPFPYDIRTKKLNDDSQVFEDYDPWTTFPNHIKFFDIWKALMISAPIKVLGEDEESLTQAVFAILSLIKPYKYYGKFAIILNQYDRRLEDAASFPVFGVLRRFNKNAKGNFAHVITQAPVIEGDYDHLRSDQIRKIQKIQKIQLYLMDRSLILNPYNDILEHNYVNPNLEKEFCSKPNPGMLSAKEIVRFTKTPTAIEFRRRNKYRDEFRNAILSVNAEEFTNQLSIADLEKLLHILNKLKMKFKGDQHIQSVFKVHMKVARHTLQEKKNKL